MVQLALYSTTHCHLCEQAEALLISLTIQYDITWIPIEIADDNNLIEKYGIRIPVIKRIDNYTEIDWPFNKEEIIDFITA
ncbi:MAG: glutaredoxin family protein [Methylotenera sp.]